MNDQQTITPVESVQTPASLADMSLAEYRAQREKSAATPEEKQPATGEPNKPAAGSNAGESAAEEGAAEETTEQSGEAAGDEKPKKKGGFQRKIEAKDREIEELKRQLAERMSARSSADAKTQPESAAPAAEGKKQDAQPAPELPKFDKPKPKLEDFDSIEAFTDALTDWKADERDWKRTQADEQAKARTEAEKVLDSWNQRKAEAQERHADYDEVLDSVSDVKLSPAHQRIFLESEHGPELAYALAQDRDQLEKFAGMSPLKAATHLGKLEASLKIENAPKPETKVSNAPRPVRPVGARATGTPDVTRMGLADYRAAREAGKIR
jgi:hypothetical protein